MVSVLSPLKQPAGTEAISIVRNSPTAHLHRDLLDNHALFYSRDLQSSELPNAGGHEREIQSGA